MFFKTAYDTTACSGYRLDSTTATLKIAFINRDIEKIDNYNIYLLHGGNAAANDVPSFAHPLLMNIENKDNLFLDVRSFGKYDNVDGTFKVQNKPDHTLALIRAKLNSVWIDDASRSFRNISHIPMAIYASWISESVGRRYGLNPKEQFDLGILAAIFYNSQFTDTVGLDERDKLRIINTLTRALHASAQDVITILDKISVVNNVADFCAKAEEATESVRLRELNPGILYMLLGGTWFGTNAKENIAVAVEHPPTWVSILVAAFSERTYKNSQIVKITERNSYRKLGDDFLRATLNLIKE